LTPRFPDFLASGTLQIYKQIGANKLCRVDFLTFEFMPKETQYSFAGQRLTFLQAGFTLLIPASFEMEQIREALKPSIGTRVLNETTKVVDAMSRDFAQAITRGGSKVSSFIVAQTKEAIEDGRIEGKEKDLETNIYVGERIGVLF
jgi:hypothetical protein